MIDANRKEPSHEGMGRAFPLWHLLWVIPIFSTALAVAARLIGGEPLTVTLLVAAPSIGLALVAAGLVWFRLAWRRLLAEIDRRIYGLERSEKKVAEAERLQILGECVAGLAHELNNPLTGLIGYLQLALDESGSPGLREVLEKASRESGRMGRTIRTLLDFARERSPRREPADLAEVARQVIAFQEYQLQVKDISVGLDAPEPAFANVDRHQMKQVLLNLVKNAADAIESEGRGGAILVRVRSSEDLLRLEVEDDGPGVPPGDAERIFDYFYTTKPSGQGTGLGLPICRQIIEAHGGTLRLASKTGGALFVAEIPAVAPETTEESPPSPGGPLSPGLVVLVADDEEAVRDYIVAVLEREEVKVRQAQSGHEAIRIAREHEVDRALVDLRMPDMGGEECARRLVAARPSLEGRIVIMSGDAYRPPRGTPFLQKPMTPEEILHSLRKAAPAGAGAQRQEFVTK